MLSADQGVRSEMSFDIYYGLTTFLPTGAKVEAERLQLRERWDYLCKLEMVGEEGAFVIGREEVLTEEELSTTLKVEGHSRPFNAQSSHRIRS